jgi:hypothetical protein
MATLDKYIGAKTRKIMVVDRKLPAFAGNQILTIVAPT